MAFQSFPNGALASVVYTLSNGQPCVNTFGAVYIGGGSYGEATLAALATRIDQWVDDHALPIISTDIDYVQTNVRGLSNENDFLVSNSANAGAGAVASADNPPQVSWAVKRVSSLTGRSARGRIFVPPPTVNQMTDNRTITSTLANAWVAALDEVRIDMALSDWLHVIISRFNAGVKRSVAVGFTVENYEYDNLIVDTQRRRIVGSF